MLDHITSNKEVGTSNLYQCKAILVGMYFTWIFTSLLFSLANTQTLEELNHENNNPSSSTGDFLGHIDLPGGGQPADMGSDYLSNYFRVKDESKCGNCTTKEVGD